MSTFKSMFKNPFRPTNYELEQKLKNMDSYYGFFKYLFVRYFKSPVSYFLFALPIVMILGLQSATPATTIFQGVFSFALTAHVFVIYGTLFFALQQSTLYKNLHTSYLRKTRVYATAFIVVFVTTLLFTWAVMLIYWLLSMIPGLYGGTIGVTNQPQGDLNWLGGDWFTVTYWSIITSILSIAIAFFFSSVTKGMKGYMALAIGYLVLMFFFGASLTRPYSDLLYVDYNTGQLLTPDAYYAMYVGPTLPGNPYAPLTTDGWWTLTDPDNAASRLFLGPSGTYVATAGYSTVADVPASWWFSLFMPHYSLNVMLNVSLQQFADPVQMGPDGLVNIEVEMFHAYTWDWTLIMVLPYAYTALFIGGGIYFTNRRSKKRK